LSELAQLDLRERVGPYPAQNAAWVAGQPLAVNHDFDFAVALGVEDVGAGIAVAQRRNKNAALAERLAKLEAIDLPALLQRLCAQGRPACAKLAGKRVRIYGFLYGERAARLRVLLELTGGEAAPATYSSISVPGTALGFAQPGALASAFAAELEQVLELSAQPKHAPSPEIGRCAAGDSTHLEGHVALRTATRIVLAASGPIPARVSCALDSYRIGSARGSPSPANGGRVSDTGVTD
jgi:hypothetical protein